MKLMNHEKHYNTLNNYYKNKFNCKVFKISLNGNFTCPNRDGRCGIGGCSFCTPLGSGDFAGSKNDDIKDQFESQKNMMQKKWKNGKYIVYFQANTNTYGKLSYIKSLFEKAITLDKDIVMISIATRPDCINEEIIDYLFDLNKRMPVQIELGLQTIHQETANYFNRGYELEVFEEAIRLIRAKGIEVVVHIINGLPFETKKMMIETVDYLSNMDIQGIKIHMLHLMKNTKMGNDYLNNPFHILSLEEYVDIVVDQILHLRKDIIIHRLTGDAIKEELIEPKWSLKKFVTTNEIDKKLRKLNLFQGDYYEAHHN
ncbi:TIGR01212 family radical SAM protein [Acholeplasma sp. OttesenSCG-928-E16]|nr:TIGR01212 family radical SAM protein [Acholeplasma sp. OttesenSCG-928-E16]